MKSTFGLSPSLTVKIQPSTLQFLPMVLKHTRQRDEKGGVQSLSQFQN
jgi:hypothetical protein